MSKLQCNDIHKYIGAKAEEYMGSCLDLRGNIDKEVKRIINDYTEHESQRNSLWIYYLIRREF